METPQLSRRDFLKIMASAAPTIFFRPKTLDYANNFTKEGVRDLALDRVQNFLRKNEDIPNAVINPPDKNERFRFADELLQSSLDIYAGWAEKSGYPPAFYNKPDYFLSIDNPNLHSKFINQAVSPFLDRLWTSIKTGKPIENEDINNLTDIKNAVIKILDGDEYQPIKFSQKDIKDAKDLLRLDPGSPILARVKARVSENATEEELVSAIHEEIDYIWEWVDSERDGKPMECDQLLAGLIYINKGDVAGSMWDLTVLTKLAARNSHKDFKFNDVKNADGQSDLATIRRENAVLLTRLQDTFSPRISANWNLENVEDTDLFAHEPSKYAPKNFKPCDTYSAGGALYHGANIPALEGIMDYRLTQIVLLLKYAFPKEKIGFNADQGWEKIMADLMTGYRSGYVQEILFALPGQKV